MVTLTFVSGGGWPMQRGAHHHNATAERVHPLSTQADSDNSSKQPTDLFDGDVIPAKWNDKRRNKYVEKKQNSMGVGFR